MHLRRQGKTPEYYITKSGAEVDFVLTDGPGQKSEVIQVCWSLDSHATRKREETAARAAMQELSIKRSTIVTWLDEASAGENLEIVPVWKWLLS
jgi:predicted AAA+ superfamily ATPase